MNAYKQALKEEMEILCANPKVIFLGQQVGAEDFYGTLSDIHPERRLEMPVAEELQMGLSIGLALEGYLPVSIYQRMDFLPRACDQLVNHLDLIKEASQGRFNPKVIIRTTIGSRFPLDTGPQHSKDLTLGFLYLLPSIDIHKVKTVEQIHLAYKFARESENSSMIIEDQQFYQ
jgi:pyruvate/2-oxoglutarate/acetoin dehydrogenase E1 component